MTGFGPDTLELQCAFIALHALQAAQVGQAAASDVKDMLGGRIQ